MPTIVAYRKYIDPEITRELRLPVDGQHQSLGTELATLADGTTYVCLPDGAVLPAGQHDEIAVSIQTVTLTTAQIAEIKSVSPHVRLISDRMQQMIRDAYSLEDEQYFSRIGVGVALGAYVFQAGEMDALLAFGAHVEAVREWGRDRRAEIGL